MTADHRAGATTETAPFLTPALMSEILQDAGYRVERFTDPTGRVQLRSATNGLAFVARFGNRGAVEGEGYADASFGAFLQVQGVWDAALLNNWNATKRFGRLYVGGNLLALEMDFVGIGVGRDYLRAQANIWDSLVQELIRFLRGASAPAVSGDVGNGGARNAALNIESTDSGTVASAAAAAT